MTGNMNLREGALGCPGHSGPHEKSLGWISPVLAPGVCWVPPPQSDPRDCWETDLLGYWPIALTLEAWYMIARYQRWTGISEAGPEESGCFSPWR